MLGRVSAGVGGREWFIAVLWVKRAMRTSGRCGQGGEADKRTRRGEAGKGDEGRQGRQARQVMKAGRKGEADWRSGKERSASFGKNDYLSDAVK